MLVNVDKNLVFFLQSSVERTWHERLICHQWAMKMLLSEWWISSKQLNPNSLFRPCRKVSNFSSMSLPKASLPTLSGVRMVSLFSGLGFISCSLFRSCWHVLDLWTRRRRARWRFWRLCVAMCFCNWVRWACRRCRITCWFFNCTGWRWRHSHITRWFCHWLGWNVCRWCFAHAVVMTPKSTCLFFLLSICSHQHERWQGVCFQKTNTAFCPVPLDPVEPQIWRLQQVRISKAFVFTANNQMADDLFQHCYPN